MADESSNGAPASEGDTGGTTTGAVTVTTELGEGGEKALREERSARRKAEKEAKDLADRLSKIEAANLSETEKAIAAARAEGAAEAMKTANERLLRAEVKAAAAGKLADPEDALKFLDPDGLVGNDGEVDSKALSSAIDDLVKSKPYLAVSATPGPGTGGGGARQQPALALNGDPLLRSVEDKLGIR